jgi:hypothetical protein
MATVHLHTKVPLTATFLTAAGDMAPVDGVPAWSVSDLNVAMVEQTPDPFTVKLVPLAPGNVSVFAVADADLGEGIRNVTLQVDLTVAPVEATSGSIAIGTSEPVIEEPTPEPAAPTEEAPATDTPTEEPPAV